MGMFCYQCEQTAKNSGCTAYGACGKDPDTAALQDLLVYVCKGISSFAHRARAIGVVDRETDIYVTEALFTTVTNVNFDAERVAKFVARGAQIRDKIRELYFSKCKSCGIEPEIPNGPSGWEPATDLSGLIRQGEMISIEKRIEKEGRDVCGLKELLCYGVKGTAAYADHAQRLGREDPSVYSFFHEALDFLTKADPSIDELLGMNLKCGEINLRVMEMLDAVHNETYGNPLPTKVRVSPIKGKAILVSGHDLRDLHDLLEQTQGRGINVYTHGEMLPAHGYPELKKFPHLAGNYGGAWQDQRAEFEAFPARS